MSPTIDIQQRKNLTCDINIPQGLDLYHSQFLEHILASIAANLSSGTFYYQEKPLDWKLLQGGNSGQMVILNGDIWKLANTEAGHTRIEGEISSYEAAANSPFGQYLVGRVFSDRASALLILEKAMGKTIDEIIKDANISINIKKLALEKLFIVEKEAIFSESGKSIERGEDGLFHQPGPIREQDEISTSVDQGNKPDQILTQTDMIISEHQDTYLRMLDHIDRLTQKEGNGYSLHEMYNLSIKMLSKTDRLHFMMGDASPNNIFWDQDLDKITAIDPEWVGFQNPFVALVRSAKINGIRMASADSEQIQMLQQHADQLVASIATEYEQAHSQSKYLSLSQHYFARVCSRLRSILLRHENPKSWEIELPLITKEFTTAIQNQRLYELTKSNHEFEEGVSLDEFKQIFVNRYDKENSHFEKGFKALLAHIFVQKGLNMDNLSETYEGLISGVYRDNSWALFDDAAIDKLSQFGETEVWTQTTSIADQKHKVRNSLHGKINIDEVGYYTTAETEINQVHLEDNGDIIIGNKLDAVIAGEVDYVLDEEDEDGIYHLDTEDFKKPKRQAVLRRDLVVIDDREDNLTQIQHKISENKISGNYYLFKIDHSQKQVPSSISEDSVIYVNSFDEIADILRQKSVNDAKIYVDFDSTLHNTKLYKDKMLQIIYETYISKD
jgi:hypothetical protein